MVTTGGGYILQQTSENDNCDDNCPQDNRLLHCKKSPAVSKINHQAHSMISGV